MQEIKYVMRKIGVPSPVEGIISAADFEEYLAYQYLSVGFKVQSVHIQPFDGGDRVSMVLVREVPEAQEKKK